MKAIIFLFVALWLPLAHGEDWTTQQKLLGASAVILHAVDWGQTRYIANSNGRFYETNPFIGKYPSEDRVDAYFAITGLGLLALAHLLPEYRTVILGVWLGVELAATGNNYRIGIKVDF